MMGLQVVIGDVWINPSLSLPDLQLWTAIVDIICFPFLSFLLNFCIGPGRNVLA